MAENATEVEQRRVEQARREHEERVARDLDADELVVVAPYITLKVKTDAGSIVRGFNAGAVVRGEDVDPDNLRHHVESGLMAGVDTPQAQFAAPAGTPMPGEPPNVAVTEQPVGALPLDERLRRVAQAGQTLAEVEQQLRRPHGNASKATWVDYAVSQRDEGTSEDEARAAAEAKSRDELIAEYGRR